MATKWEYIQVRLHPDKDSGLKNKVKAAAKKARMSQSEWCRAVMTACSSAQLKKGKQ
jgi:hypothetical protein